MNLITLENISKSYSDKKLLDEINLGINDDEKIGIVGINGMGKSTLLKIIAGIESVDSGSITKKNSLVIEYLSQEPDYDFEITVLEQVFKGTSKEMKILKEYEEVLEKVVAGDISLNDKLLNLQQKMDNFNLWDLESEAKNILTKLEISNFEEKIKNLSGGQRKRIALASSLISPCDLLILDEPTNHMDSYCISWLEEYLNKRRGGLLMITHDRYFLDVVANRIIEVDGGKIYSYQGNYNTYIEKKMERETLEESLKRKRENLFRKELAWIRRGAKARSTKQKARIDRFETLKEDMVNVSKEDLELSIVWTRLGSKTIEFKNISKSFGERTLIKDFSYMVLKEDRIGIIGKNGMGKSTLLKMINKELKPDYGEIEFGETVKVGIFSQENYHMDENQRVIDYVKDIAEFLPLANGDRVTAGKMLERFLFKKDSHYSLIGKLSGGEKRRLYLLRVLMDSPNVLLLDEPTNDLDTTTLAVLEDFLDTFKGIIITVSHDRYFLDRVCNKIFSYEDGGKITIYNGNYTSCEKQVEEALRLGKVSVEKKKKDIPVKPKKLAKLKFSFKEEREFKEIDDIIAGLENKIAELDAEMEGCATQYSKIQKLLKEKEEAESLLLEKYDRWEYLNDLAEKIKAEKNG